MELLIVMAIFGFVLAGTSQMVVSLLTTNRQQSKIAESNIEGIIGLELLRQDLGKAGYGLPWNGLISYSETASNPHSLDDAPHTPKTPKGIVSSNGGGWNNTDYLAVKAANVATNAASNKWTFLTPANTTTLWTSATTTADNFSASDWVIVLTPGSLNTEDQARTLIASGSAFSAQYNSTASLASSMSSTGIVYGIDVGTNTPALTTLRMPFNRADYYVSRPATGMPQRCAVGTGILYKAVVNQGDGTFMPGMPLLDCVADMQVIFRWDQLGDGVLQPRDDISTLSAQDIHDKVKEVRVYILAHEGQKDANFKYATNPIYVGADSFGSSLGRSFDFSAMGITTWQSYRWKIYTLVVKLDNLL